MICGSKGVEIVTVFRFFKNFKVPCVKKRKGDMHDKRT